MVLSIAFDHFRRAFFRNRLLKRRKSVAVASAWLKAAKAMKGGENMEVYLNFPTAAYMGENDFI
jgi:hypothetical protein